jgi:hypothetical protein
MHFQQEHSGIVNAVWGHLAIDDSRIDTARGD